jgi:hypothetical protein
VIRAALIALLAAAPAFAEDAPSPKRMMIDIPNFQKATRPRAADRGMICRKTPETGSLVKTRCRCATPEEWAKTFAITNIYDAAVEQQSRTYFDAAECHPDRQARRR